MALKPIWMGFLFVASLCPLFARGDTIYLKNGRQIQGINPIRQNGKVSFETAAGSMSVPESLVDHIVSGDVPIAPQRSSNSAATDLQMAPPSSNAVDSASVLQSILRDGAVDERALTQIDSTAAAGGAAGFARAIAAESGSRWAIFITMDTPTSSRSTSPEPQSSRFSTASLAP